MTTAAQTITSSFCVCRSLYFVTTIWVAAGMQKPVNSKAEMYPLCLLQTRAGNSLQVKRQHLSAATSTGKESAYPYLHTSVNVSMLSHERIVSSADVSSTKAAESSQSAHDLPLFARGSAEKSPHFSKQRQQQQLHQPAFDVLTAFDSEHAQLPASLAQLSMKNSDLAWNPEYQQSSFDIKSFMDKSQNSTRSAERLMFIMHVVLSIVVVSCVMGFAIVSACNSQTQKSDDARAILDHIAKAGIHPRPLYGATTFQPPPPHSEAFNHLCPMPEVADAGNSYLLPDLAEMKSGMASFDVLTSDGEKLLEGVINNEARDAGILLQQPKTEEGPGAPVAFVSTSRAALAFGNIPIVQPHAGNPQGDHFGILKRIADDKYSVVRKNHTVMVIEGHIASRCIRIHTALADSARRSHHSIGSTRPCKDRHGQSQVELHAGSGVDTGLAILCLLTIIRLEASRAAPT